MSSYSIGIDPGVQGAICVLGGDTPRQVLALVPMPTQKDGKGRDALDLVSLSTLFSSWALLWDPLITIEQLQPMPMDKGGTLANYSRGRSLGVLEALATAHRLRYQLVRPQVWQKEMLAGVEGTDTGARSIIAAQRLFPGVLLLRTERSRKLDDGLADALLIAEYGRRKGQGER